MPSVVDPHTVGVIGPVASSQFVLERLLLRQDFVATACCSPGVGAVGCCSDPTRPLGSAQQVIDDPQTQVIYFAGPIGAELLLAALQRGKHVVLSPAAAMIGADELRRLAEIAADRGLVAVIDEPRRWDDDFRSAMTVAQSGRLGVLLRIRLSLLTTALPGEEFTGGVLSDLGWHWLDQLLSFVDDDLLTARLRQFYPTARSNDAGFMATMEFASGTSAVIELQTQSLLSLRTGWLLEGTTGAYRAGRQYTKTADGEIIDEQVALPSLANDPFLDALSLALQETTPAGLLMPLKHAARIAELIESLRASTLSAPGR